MATQRLQPQRVPLGTLTLPNGKELPVLITSEWYRALQLLTGQVNTTVTTVEQTTTVVQAADDIGPPPHAAPVAIDSLNEAADGHSLLAIAVAQTLQASQADPLVLWMQARIAELAGRVDALEQSP